MNKITNRTYSGSFTIKVDPEDHELMKALGIPILYLNGEPCKVVSDE